MLQDASHFACAMAHSVISRTHPTCDTPCGGQAILCLGDTRYVAVVPVVASVLQMYNTCFVCLFCAPPSLCGGNAPFFSTLFAGCCGQHAPCRNSDMSDRPGVTERETPRMYVFVAQDQAVWPRDALFILKPGGSASLLFKSAFEYGLPNGC